MLLVPATTVALIRVYAVCALQVRWYLDRQLAEVVEETPSIAIRLKFTPRGSGHADDQYYLSDKDNRWGPA